LQYPAQSQALHQERSATHEQRDFGTGRECTAQGLAAGVQATRQQCRWRLRDSVDTVTSVDLRFSLVGKVAVVTGGAGGIGCAIAAALSSAGANVVVADMTAPSSKVPRDPETHAVEHRQLDVTREPAVDDLFAGIVEDFGGIDVLVNGAGVALRAPAVEHTVEAWNKVMAVNVTGTFLCSRAAARHMIAAGRGGAIVNIASIMGMSGGGLYPNVSYQTSKGAVVNMTRCLALEWAPHRIRVNAVAPTYVRTEFIRAIVEDPELVRRIEAMTPLGRLAEPDEVASATLFLASSSAAMITGHILPVDGGFLAQ
jgi:2-deoxy-D-gluconate 3-dehydrogenase